MKKLKKLLIKITYPLLKRFYNKRKIYMAHIDFATGDMVYTMNGKLFKTKPIPLNQSIIIT